MSRDTLLEQQLVKRVKCVRCGKKKTVNDDQLCDSCSFTVSLENIIDDRKSTQ